MQFVAGGPLDEDLGRFDAVVAPPDGAQDRRAQVRAQWETIEVKAERSVLTLLSGSRSLAEQGIGIALLSTRARESLANELPRFGLHVSAVVALHPLMSAASSLALEIVVWSAVEYGSVFVGRFVD